MVRSRVGEVVSLVERFGGERLRRWVLHHEDAVRVGLNEPVPAERVHVLILRVKAARVGEGVCFELLPRRQHHGVIDLVERAGAVHGSVDVGDLLDRQPCVKCFGELDDGAFPHAVDDKVRARIKQDGALQAVLPVIVVGEAAQARLNAAQDDGRVLEGAADEVAVHDGRMVGARAHAAAGRVGVGATAVLAHAVVVDHGVHVARRDEEGKPRLAERRDACGVAPVGLGDEAHPVPVRLEQPADDGRSEAGMIHVGVAADIDEVALVPAAGLHVGARGGEEVCSCEAERRGARGVDVGGVRRAVLTRPRRALRHATRALLRSRWFLLLGRGVLHGAPVQM